MTAQSMAGNAPAADKEAPAQANDGAAPQTSGAARPENELFSRVARETAADHAKAIGIRAGEIAGNAIAVTVGGLIGGIMGFYNIARPGEVVDKVRSFFSGLKDAVMGSHSDARETALERSNLRDIREVRRTIEKSGLSAEAKSDLHQRVNRTVEAYRNQYVEAGKDGTITPAERAEMQRTIQQNLKDVRTAITGEITRRMDEQRVDREMADSRRQLEADIAALQARMEALKGVDAVRSEGRKAAEAQLDERLAAAAKLRPTPAAAPAAGPVDAVAPSAPAPAAPAPDAPVAAAPAAGGPVGAPKSTGSGMEPIGV